jgi:hypothetical protein
MLVSTAFSNITKIYNLVLNNITKREYPTRHDMVWNAYRLRPTSIEPFPCSMPLEHVQVGDLWFYVQAKRLVQCEVWGSHSGVDRDWNIFYDTEVYRQTGSSVYGELAPSTFSHYSRTSITIYSFPRRYLQNILNPWIRAWIFLNRWNFRARSV